MSQRRRDHDLTLGRDPALGGDQNTVEARQSGCHCGRRCMSTQQPPSAVLRKGCHDDKRKGAVALRKSGAGKGRPAAKSLDMIPFIIPLSSQTDAPPQMHHCSIGSPATPYSKSNCDIWLENIQHISSMPPLLQVIPFLGKLKDCPRLPNHRGP